MLRLNLTHLVKDATSAHVVYKNHKRFFLIYQKYAFQQILLIRPLMFNFRLRL